MAESSKNFMSDIKMFPDLVDLESYLSTGNLEDGQMIALNGVPVSVWTGSGAPTTSQLAHSICDVYYDTTNNKFYKCTSVTVSGSSLTTAWKRLATEDDLTDVLRFSSMTLTDAQKGQARANIDAYTLVEYTGSETSYADQTLYFTTD